MFRDVLKKKVHLSLMQKMSLGVAAMFALMAAVLLLSFLAVTRIDGMANGIEEAALPRYTETTSLKADLHEMVAGIGLSLLSGETKDLERAREAKDRADDRFRRVRSLFQKDREMGALLDDIGDRQQQLFREAENLLSGGSPIQGSGTSRLRSFHEKAQPMLDRADAFAAGLPKPAASFSTIHEGIHGAERVILWLGIMALLAPIGIVLLLRRSVVQPMERIVSLMQKAELGDFTSTFENPFLLKCWEVLKCSREDCPAYHATDLRCWQTSGTHCKGEVQGDMARKLGDCEKCAVYRHAAGDEFSKIGEAINNMMKSTTATLGRFNMMAGKVFSASEQLSALSRSIRTGSDEQTYSLKEADATITGMNSNLAEITETVDSLFAAAEGSSAAVLQMSASIGQVAENTQSLSQTFRDTSQDIDSLFSSIKETSMNIETLASDFATVSGSITEMSASVRETEKDAKRARDFSAHLADQVLKSNEEAVQRAVDGIEKISDVVNDASATIRELGRKSEDIGSILRVIKEVSEQTNLLALNAAIIAAQAGDYGKGFSVVADEIRELSERTASSTHEIDSLIRTIQGGLNEAVTSMEKGSASVQKGVGLIHDVREKLAEATDDSQKSAAAANNIVKATAEQSEGIRKISATGQQISEMAATIAETTRQQSGTCDSLHHSVARINEMTIHVRKATDEQAKTSRHINETSKNTTFVAEKVKESTATEAAGIELVLGAIEGSLGMAIANLIAVEKLDEMISLLERQANSLSESLEQFVLPETPKAQVGTH